MKLSEHLKEYHLRALSTPCTTKERARHTGAEILESNSFPRHCSVMAILYDPETLAEFDGPAWYVISCRQPSSINVRRLDRMGAYHREKLEAWTTFVLGSVGDKGRERIIQVSSQEIGLIRPAYDYEFACTDASRLPREIAKRWWGADAGFVIDGA